MLNIAKSPKFACIVLSFKNFCTYSTNIILIFINLSFHQRKFFYLFYIVKLNILTQIFISNFLFLFRTHDSSKLTNWPSDNGRFLALIFFLFQITSKGNDWLFNIFSVSIYNFFCSISTFVFVCRVRVENIFLFNLSSVFSF